MLYKLWINLLILLKILTFIRGYPDGAPERACFIMVPRHTHPHTYRPIFKQHGPSPYNITLSRTTWRSDTAIRACEDGHTDWPTGIFYSESPDARPLWCVDRNDAITHNNSNWKSSVTVLATVVTNRTTYWTSIKSSMIVQDATQTAAAGGGEAPEGGAQTGMMPGLDAWGYPTTPSWNWGGGNGGGGGGGGTGGWGNNRGNNGGGSNPNGSSKTGGWGNGGGNNQGGPGGSEGNNWGNSGNRPPSGSWGNNGSSGGNNWGNNGRLNIRFGVGGNLLFITYLIVCVYVCFVKCGCDEIDIFNNYFIKVVMFYNNIDSKLSIL
ncbi:hypothetical protein KUTeg_001619 [Tegillarca granosa]|uniref:Uncharacterized protein n=1 Tax=Tegillarca granosa TaxID=220873 RepID=A0ABQ9FRZ0_TEGGR|nr:hypothetical protein KUTeg_001619 [Tegillarca granosa]